MENPLRYSWSGRLLSTTLILLCLGLGILHSVHYYYVRQDTIRQIQEELKGVVVSTALLIDPEAYLDLVWEYPTPDDIYHPKAQRLFSTLVNPLKQVQAANEIETDIYTLSIRQGFDALIRSDPSKTVVNALAFILMTDETVYFRNQYAYHPFMKDPFFEGKPAVTGIYSDAHGQWISAFAPIQSSSDRIVGVLVVDFDATQFSGLIFQKMRPLIGVSVGILVGIAGVLFFFVWQIRHQVADLTTSITQYDIGKPPAISELVACHELGEIQDKMESKLTTSQLFWEALSHVYPGLFMVVNSSLMFENVLSQTAQKEFGPIAGQSFDSILKHPIEPGHRDRIIALFNQDVTDESLILLTDLLPQNLQLGSQHYDLTYYPILTGHRITHIALSGSNTQALDRAAREADEAQAMLTIFQHYESFNDMVVITEQVFKKLDHLKLRLSQDPKISDVYQVCHYSDAIKSNAEMFGLVAVAEQAKRLEQAMRTLHSTTLSDRKIRDQALGSIPDLKQAFQNQLSKIRNLVLIDKSNQYGITQREVEQIYSLDNLPPDVMKILDQLGKRLLEDVVVPKATLMAQAAAQEFRKQVRCDFKKLPSIRVENHWLSPLDMALRHIIGNAIDHGIESPEERKQEGKPEKGVIMFSAETNGSEMVLRIRDDGQGINTQSVVASAVSRFLISKENASKLSVDEIYQLLLSPGFSTKSGADNYSGKNVGLDAVSSTMTDMGGSLTISSKQGVYTEFKLVFPY